MLQPFQRVCLRFCGFRMSIQGCRMMFWAASKLSTKKVARRYLVGDCGCKGGGQLVRLCASAVSLLLGSLLLLFPQSGRLHNSQMVSTRQDSSANDQAQAKTELEYSIVKQMIKSVIKHTDSGPCWVASQPRQLRFGQHALGRLVHCRTRLH